MPRSIPLNLIGEAYADESLPWSAQEAINCEFIPAETDGTRSAGKMPGTPGLKSWATVGTGGWRGGIVMDGVAYVVMDTTLYSVASDGTETSLGTIEGSGRVGIAENGTHVVVVNGTKGWVYNAGTSTFAEITDADFPEADDCGFIGNYIVFVDQDTDQYFWSDLGDATSYDALNFASAETDSDGLLALVPLQRDLWFFGAESTEVHRFTGSSDTFELVTTIERGIASTFAKAKLDNTIYWLGENGIVYRAQGYSAIRVSKRPIEQAIRDENLSEAFAFAYEDGGSAYFVLTFPSGKTWVYNVATGKWHRRKSFEQDRWRANGYLYAYNKHLIGDSSQGIVWELDHDTYAEGSDALVWERKTQYVHANGEYIRGAELELEFEAGVGLATGQGSDPIVEMCYSDDGGRTYKDWRQESLGTIADYSARVRFHGLGRFRQRNFWLRISDPVPRVLLAATGRAAD